VNSLIDGSNLPVNSLDSNTHTMDCANEFSSSELIDESESDDNLCGSANFFSSSKVYCFDCFPIYLAMKSSFKLNELLFVLFVIISIFRNIVYDDKPSYVESFKSFGHKSSE
jgi:hypothetical protein